MKTLSGSELRRGYYKVFEWAISSPRKPANIAFTEGDCRLAAQLIEEINEYEARR